MFDRTREFFAKLFTPVARFLLARGVSPDVVTIVGTLGVCAGSLVFFPTGHLLIGVLVITVFVFSDTVDGVMARMQGRSSKWGAFLDSTLDRFGDAAIFSGLVFYYMGVGDSKVWAGFALACLVMGSLTSYARARAEGLGMTAKGGIAERADRLVSVLVAAGFSGMGVPYILEVVLVLLAVASSITVVQRILIVRRQALPPAAADAIEPTAITAASATDDPPTERPGGQPPEPPVAPSNAAPSNAAPSNAAAHDRPGRRTTGGSLDSAASPAGRPCRFRCLTTVASPHSASRVRSPATGSAGGRSGDCPNAWSARCSTGSPTWPRGGTARACGDSGPTWPGWSGRPRLPSSTP